MKTQTYLKAINPFLVLLLIGNVVSLQSCKSDKKKAIVDEEKKENVINIVTQHMDFQMPDTIPSGWVTFRYQNGLAM